MSSTPRKRRNHQHTSSNSQSHHNHGHGHQRTRSQHLAAQEAAAQVTSDYESDTALYMAAHPPVPAAQLTVRTNTDLNLAVLQRYLPTITSILGIAANAVVYSLDTTAGDWQKANIEGTLFVCQLGDSIEKCCIFILNRKGIDNMTLHLGGIRDVELTQGILMLHMDGHDGEQDDGTPSKIWGLFIHEEQQQQQQPDSSAQSNADLIKALWHKARESRAAQQDRGERVSLQGGGAGFTMPGLGGRQVSLNELFGR
ncbi:hypothetical protein JX265_003190 [Neoarthrinium moseri]|uniref:PH domain-like protein n=1 Tax=Neoarthrinium moseri TaxID=1658444 RepID=A0A9Q0ASL8_9PEZI|nr:hypothetical protein JX265_003190 [Neoarthrinium moseri]